MRLIDADAFKQQVAAECVAGNHNTKRASALLTLIDMQATAYDVQKTAEQIRELNDNEFTLAAVMGIVRRGGVK